MAPDPYQALGISPGASDQEVHRAYRRLVQLHHPDHNSGSSKAAQRFEEVQEAYDRITESRRLAGASPPRQPEQAPPPRPADPDADARLAEIERELREAYEARERAREAAREAAAATGARRASDEELGYVTTDDSLSEILSDARAELSNRFTKAREHPVAKSIYELIDELASKINEPPQQR
jgi:curved DNA-binding protein CbpA